jgi:hypothetical protein
MSHVASKHEGDRVWISGHAKKINVDHVEQIIIKHISRK